MRLPFKILTGLTVLMAAAAASAYAPNYRWSFVSTPILSGRLNDTSTDYDTSPTLARLQYDGTTDAAANSGVWTYFFEADTDNEVHIHATIPNAWVRGPSASNTRAIYPALRWAPNTADTGTDGVADNVVIGIEYVVADKDEAYATTTTVSRTVAVGTTAKKAWLTDIPSTGITPNADIGASIPIRVFRDANNAADTFTDTIAILDFVLYIEQEPATAGSRQRQTR